jgi:flagellar biosynthesis protein FlhG
MNVETAERQGIVLAVTSGKGGVGKTNLSINLAVGLTQLGHRVAIVDADYGLGNVDVMLGLMPEVHVAHLLSGERQLTDVLIEGPAGIRVLPAGSGVQPLTALDEEQRERLTAAIRQARQLFDYVIVDTAAGISDNVVEMLKLAEHVLLVTSLDPAALVDAYAVAKVLWKASDTARIGLIVNGVRDGVEGRLAFRQIDLAAERFLGHRLVYLGFIPEDPWVREATTLQRPVVEHMPQAPASRNFRLLATRVSSMSAGPGGLRLVPAPGSVDLPREVPQCA